MHSYVVDLSLCSRHSSLRPLNLDHVEKLKAEICFGDMRFIPGNEVIIVIPGVENEENLKEKFKLSIYKNKYNSQSTKTNITSFPLTI